MNIVQVFPYFDHPEQFAGNNTFGAGVVQGTLLAEIAGSRRCTQICLLAENFLNRPTAARDHPKISQYLSGLGLHKSVRVITLLEFTNEILPFPTVVIASGPEVNRWLNIRKLLNPISFPLCCFLHSLIWPDFFQGYSYALSHGKAYDRFVTPGKTSEKIFLNLCQYVRTFASLSTSPPKTLQLPYCVNVKEYGGYDKSASKRLLGLRDHETTMLFVGRISEHYKADLDPLLVVLRRLLRNGISIQLVVAGSDPQGHATAEFERKVALLNLSDHVFVMANFDSRLKPVLYNAADFCVCPADNIQETHGISLLESMAASRAVIASNWSGYRDIVRDGETGILIPSVIDPIALGLFPMLAGGSPSPIAERFLARKTIIDVDALESAILELSKDPNRCRQLGIAGYERVIEHYSWPSVIEKFFDAWERQYEESVGSFISPQNCADESHEDDILSGFASSDAVTWEFALNNDGRNVLADGSKDLSILTGGESVVGRLALQWLVEHGETTAFWDGENGANPYRDSMTLLAKKGFLSIRRSASVAI
jgi:glycosyltransferase involved in cell wall biosynthesis